MSTSTATPVNAKIRTVPSAFHLLTKTALVHYVQLHKLLNLIALICDQDDNAKFIVHHSQQSGYYSTHCYDVLTNKFYRVETPAGIRPLLKGIADKSGGKVVLLAKDEQYSHPTRKVQE